MGVEAVAGRGGHRVETRARDGHCVGLGAWALFAAISARSNVAVVGALFCEKVWRGLIYGVFCISPWLGYYKRVAFPVEELVGLPSDPTRASTSHHLVAVVVDFIFL